MNLDISRMGVSILSRKSVYIACAAIIHAILLCTSSYFLYTSPSVGITTSWDKSLQRWKVESAEPWSSLKEGDVIQSIGGIEIRYMHLIKSFSYLNHRKEIFEWFDKTNELYEVLKGSEVTFIVSRGPDKIEGTLSAQICRFSFLNSSSILVLLFGFVFLLIGVVAYWKKEKDKRCFVLFLFCAFASIANTTNVAFFSSALVLAPRFGFLNTIMNWTAVTFCTTALVYLLLLLPGENAILRRFPKLPWVLCALLVACGASLEPPIAFFSASIAFIMAIFISARSFFTCDNPVERQQMKWVGAGFAFGFGPILALSFIPHVLRVGDLIDPRYSVLFMVIFPLSISFAIYRYRLIGIDDLLGGVFIYIATMGLLAGVDLCLMSALASRYGTSLELHPTGRLLVSLIVTISIYAVIRERLRLYVRRLFGREPLNEREILASFTDEASGQEPQSIAKLLESSVKHTFRPKSLKLLAGKDGTCEGLADVVHGRSEPVLLWESPLQEALPVKDMLLALPLGRGEEAEYILLLGELPGGKLYGNREMGILRSLLNQAKLLYENAWLYDENLRYCRAILEEEKKHLEEKEKILRDLHDGIGGIMTNIGILSAIAQKPTPTKEVQEPLLTISELSREGLSEIRTIMHSLDDSSLTWEGLIGEMRSLGAKMIEANGMAFEMECPSCEGRRRPGSLLFLNLLRICKECLTNIIKHSGANRVQVRFEIGPEKIELRVQDDGVGIKGKGSKPGRGLSHMRARAADIGAAFSVSSGSGTTVHLEIP
jgi:signal transduction histidine kinase